MLALSLGGIVVCKKRAQVISLHICVKTQYEETACVIQETVQIRHLDLELPEIQNCEQQTSVVYGPPGLLCSSQVSKQTESTKSASYFLLQKRQPPTTTSCPLSITSTVLRTGDTVMLLTCAAYHLLGQQAGEQHRPKLF